MNPHKVIKDDWTGVILVGCQFLARIMIALFDMVTVVKHTHIV